MRELFGLRRKKWFVQWLGSILPKPKALESPKAKRIVRFARQTRKGQASPEKVSPANPSHGCGVGKSSLDGEGAAQLSTLVMGQGGKTGARSLKMHTSPRLRAGSGRPNAFFIPGGLWLSQKFHVRFPGKERQDRREWRWDEQSPHPP